MGWPEPIPIGPAAFTASTTVFGLLAALSDRYHIARFGSLFDHGVLRKFLLYILVANALLAIFSPLRSAVYLVLILLFLAWRIEPRESMRRETGEASKELEEITVETEGEQAMEAYEETFGR